MFALSLVTCKLPEAVYLSNLCDLSVNDFKNKLGTLEEKKRQTCSEIHYA